MEVLSLILSKASHREDFCFHWRTKQLRITHLLFADDLILFCKGEPTSAGILKDCLRQFSALSGLQLNRSKSSAYFSNVSPHIQQLILDDLEMQLGLLPARFLGVPLITTKLSVAHCQPLIFRIKNKVTSWTHCSLSYAGRLQLIHSILYAIQSYWSAHFFLPVAVLKEIQKIFTRFLWKGPSLQPHGAKVAWDKITFPLCEGGLGLKHLREWNQAQLILKLWQLVIPSSSSLWARWVKDTVLKGTNFWIVAIPADCSWIWRKILKLRSIAAPHLHFTVGNGASISLWFDPWINHSPLASSVHDPLIIHSRLPPQAKVQSIIRNGTWLLPSSNHSSIIDFRTSFDHNRPICSNLPDSLLWGNSNKVNIKSRDIWASIRERGVQWAWHPLVWHKGIPPRLSFILWLAFHHGLRTKDKLLRYGIIMDPICVLCHTHVETFDHLFFDCPFSFEVLFVLLRRCGWNGSSRQWGSITNFLLHVSTGAVKKFVLYLSFAEVVYHLWKERNSRTHNPDHKIPARTLTNQIMTDLRCRLATYVKFQKIKHSPWCRQFTVDSLC